MKVQLEYCGKSESLSGTRITSMLSSFVEKDSEQIPESIDIVQTYTTEDGKCEAKLVTLNTHELARIGWWLRGMYRE